MKKNFGLIVIALTIFSLNTHARSVLNNGGMEGGGGNSYQGRPLESYIQDPQELLAYKNFLKDIQSKFSYGSLDPFFAHVLIHKTWYFVPGPLNKLSSEQLGAVVPTDQVALQGFESVWVDRDLFAKMTLDDQAHLLFHEVLMGLKLLRFQSMQEQCFVIITRPENAYQCERQHTVRYGKPSDLIPRDYDEIRKTVVDLRDLPAGTSYQDLADLLARRNFIFPFRPFQRKGTSSIISGTEVIETLQDDYLANNWPHQLYRFSDFFAAHPDLKNGQITQPTTWSPLGSCQLDPFQYQHGHLLGRYSSQAAGMLRREFKLDINLNSSTSYVRGFDINNPLDSRQSVFFSGDTMISQAQPGQQSVGDHLLYVFFLSSDEGAMEGIHIEEHVITKVGDPSRNGVGQETKPVRGGVNEICSVRPQITIEP